MTAMNETGETTLPEHLSLLRADLNVVWSNLFVWSVTKSQKPRK
jgi:hypothetical protein